MKRHFITFLFLVLAIVFYALGAAGPGTFLLLLGVLAEATFAEIDTDVGFLPTSQTEEEQVTGLERIDRYGARQLVETIDRMRQPRTTGTREAVDNQAAAVEALLWGIAAVPVARAQHFACCVDDGRAQGRRARIMSKRM